MANVFVEEATLKSIADSIRNKTGKTEAMLPNEMPAEIESIETGDGGVGFETYANSIQFANLNLFGKEELTLNLDNAITLNNVCRSYSAENDNTTVKHLTINCLLPVTNISNMILATSGDNVLERITFNVDTSEVTSTTYSFARLKALKIIDGTPLDFSEATSISSATFSTVALEEIRFAPKSIFVNFPFSTSAVLSNESIQSVIDGLADLTGKATQTLDLHSNVINKLTDEQWLQIGNKNWSAT